MESMITEALKVLQEMEELYNSHLPDFRKDSDLPRKMVVDEPEQIMEHMKTINHLMKKTKPCWIEDAMSRMPVRLAELDLFLTCCHQCHNYEAFTFAALFHNRLDTITSFKGSNIVDCLEDAFWTDLLTFLASQEKWSCIKKLLMHSSRPPYAKLCELLMDVSLNEDSLELLQFLLDSMSHFDVPLLKNMLASALRCGRSQQFKMLVCSKNSIIRDTVSEKVSNGYLPFLVHQVCLGRQCYPDQVSEYNSCLSVAYEAGLFSARTRDVRERDSGQMLALAALYKMPDIVNFLCKIGAASNRDIFRFSQFIRKARTTAKKTGCKRIHRTFTTVRGVKLADISEEYVNRIQYLVTKTADSKPSSLLDLSLQEVSRRVGWGHVREPNVQRLPVPDPLKEMLAFKQFGTCAICDKIIAIDHSCKQ